MKRIINFLGFVVLFIGTLYAAKPQAFTLDPYNPEYAPHTVLIKFRDEAQLNTAFAKTSGQSGINAVDRIMNKYNVIKIDRVFKNARPVFAKKTFVDPSGQIHDIPNLDKIYRIKYQADIDPKDIAEELMNEPSLDYAEPDYYVYMMLSPDDPFYQSTDQWYIDVVNAPAAWDSTTADTNQIISIIDTGVDWDHPDLDDNIWINRAESTGIEGVDDDGNGYIDDIRGWDFINDDNDPNDDNSHGTHVAGIAAAETNNGIGVAGIAPNARIMPIKVLQSSGSGNSSDLAAGIDYAARNGATVINMSLGSYGESITVKTALENAYATAVLVAAAGNNGYKVDPPYPPFPPYAPMYPACYGFVLGVEASKTIKDDIYGWRTSFSNYDPSGPVDVGNFYNHNYEVLAPGADIYSTFPNGNYRDLSGTSMASPIVAGTVALMKSYNSTQSTEQLFAKLIQSSNDGVLDIENALDYPISPELAYLSYTIVDTLPGCDRDGIADVGEMIEVYLSVKNAGGKADSVWTILRFGEFEDQSVATITDSLSYIGDISAYAQLTGEPDPFVIEIGSDLANNRDIIFEYEILTDEGSKLKNNFIVTVQNGVELTGVYTELTTLTPDKFYIVPSNVVFDSLIIQPGTTIRFNNDAGLYFNYLYAVGKPDSMITFTRNQSGYWGGISDKNTLDSEIRYCIIEYCGGWNLELNIIEDCIVRNNVIPSSTGMFYEKNVHVNKCTMINNIYHQTFFKVQEESQYNVACNNYCSVPQFTAVIVDSDFKFKNGIMFNNAPYNYTSQTNNWDIYKAPPNYWGMEDQTTIEAGIEDFFEYSYLAVVTGKDSALTIPPSECHGVVWKMEINDVLINKYDNPFNADSGLGIIGSELLKFDVYFNRAMDTTVTPFVTFGVREPYTQHVVVDSASWSADSTVWTGYYTVGLETGDGIQHVRVALAEDNEHFEIPVEDTRFEFVIQAASAAGVKFYANAGIGKVDLEWSKSARRDELGYNVYRFIAYPDLTCSDTLRVNTGLVTDTLFTDYNVIPDSTYRYMFTVVGTDMSESDYSKSIGATVLAAANGDANGDQNVNVLDIISMVTYILDGDPNPFLFDAADINSDGSINVLDIIGVVNIILHPGMGKTSIANATECVFYLDNDKIETSTNGAIGGYQFIINGNIDGLTLHSEYPLELATTKLNDEQLLVLAYSLSGTMIPEGNHAILTLSHTDDLTFSDLVVSDLYGYPVASSFGTSTDIVVPTEFALDQNYPNPFNASTTIRYQIPQMSDVTLSIYNILGQKVYEQQMNAQRAGFYSYNWQGYDNAGHLVASGVYIYRFSAGEFVDSKKMILMK
jgi:subtilisin family serine protease